MTAAAGTVTPLDPARYRRLPWKNGGGVSVDMAWEGVSFFTLATMRTSS